MLLNICAHSNIIDYMAMGVLGLAMIAIILVILFLFFGMF